MVCDKTELALLALPADMNCLVAEPTSSDIATNAALIAARHRIIRFKGSIMIEVPEPYLHFIPLTKEHFEQIARPLLGWVKQSHLNGVFRHLSYTVQDLSYNDHLVLFGNLADGATGLTVWDMDTLEGRSDIAPADCVRRSPYSMQRSPSAQPERPIPFILSLAGGDIGLYSDILQSLAPLIMRQKPVGVIWLVGSDAHGKAALLDALNKLFPDQLSALTVKQMIGGRSNTLQLNGMLGNVAEDSDSQVTDLEIYKSIGTHENFHVRKYHCQHGAEVQGNVHHIFLANNAPTFSRRGQSVEWRTQVIPISQRFDSQQAYSLTDSLFGQLISEMCRYSVQLRYQGYHYEWSSATLATQANYSAKYEKPHEVHNRLNLAPVPFLR